MVSPPSTPASHLSYLVGPGPRATGPVSTLRVGLSNLDESVHALRLSLAVYRCDGTGLPLVRAEWGGMLPRRSRRELTAAIDWHKGELVLEQRSTPFEPTPRADGAQLHLVRAELLDGSGGTPDVLQVGLRSYPPPPSRT